MLPLFTPATVPLLTATSDDLCQVPCISLVQATHVCSTAYSSFQMTCFPVPSLTLLQKTSSSPHTYLCSRELLSVIMLTPAPEDFFQLPALLLLLRTSSSLHTYLCSRRPFSVPTLTSAPGNFFQLSCLLLLLRTSSSYRPYSCTRELLPVPLPTLARSHMPQFPGHTPIVEITCFHSLTFPSSSDPSLVFPRLPCVHRCQKGLCIYIENPREY